MGVAAVRLGVHAAPVRLSVLKLFGRKSRQTLAVRYIIAFLFLLDDIVGDDIVQDDDRLMGGCSCSKTRCSCCNSKTFSSRIMWKKVKAKLSSTFYHCILIFPR